MAWLKKGDPIPTKGKGARLSPHQKRFVDSYTDPASPGYLSPTRAAKEAGYKGKNHSALGVELMQHPLISIEIEERQKKAEERYEKKMERMALTAEFVLYKLMDLVEETEKDNDRIRALELLGKNLGLFRDRTEISGPDGKAIEMEQKIKENVEDFKRKLSRLASTGGAGTVVKFPDGSGDSGS